MSARQYVSRLDGIIERAPKEGYKAAVVLGVINSVRTLIEDLDSLVEKIKCVSDAKGGCRDGLCRPSCGGLTLIEAGDSVVVEKYRGNAFGATLGVDGVEVKVKDARLRLAGSEIELYFPSGDEWVSKTVNLEDYEAVYENSYAVKYVMKRLARPVRKSLEAINGCSKMQAIVC